MDDLERRVVILSLVARKGDNPDLWGYARLRKSILLLQIKEDVPLGFVFGLERERPVSPELQLFLERMLYDNNLVSTETPSGFRRDLGSEGIRLLKEHPDIAERYSEQVDRVFERVRDMSLTDLRVAARNAYLSHPS
ncbi:MAG: hypothetical protein WCS47_02240 [Thermovirgaceae bacterium]|jgi:hypothetical protein|nr:hypothetical protein [Synergistales bacterium]MDI9393325.1 hypothetical protein [Synergistota bacterium]HRW87446.1 hypothetical protein [Thermovirgaceae bacterium]MDD3133048.1 hypothetical protein [Synergistales bacterium]MDD3830535.1 hypothetical protein [Synergistales bacterium]